MGKIAFVFPGQGSQAVGMGEDIYREDAGAAALFDTADRALGYALTDLIFRGPEEQLKLTCHTQPALLTTSLAYYDVFRRKGIRPDYVGGHSLGEYSALVVAGVLAFEDAVRAVRARGEYMEQAVPAGQGAMAAVLGAERQRLADLCGDISEREGVVELANMNCPGQIVVSGSAAGVRAVVERAREAGAKRAIPLAVSGPFHSSLMKPAAGHLAEYLQKIPMSAASVPVVANVTARPVRDADEIRGLLVEQVCSPVLWEDSVRWLIDQGVDHFIEIGAGSVLSGLIRKIDARVRVDTVGSKAAIDQFQV